MSIRCSEATTTAGNFHSLHSLCIYLIQFIHFNDSSLIQLFKLKWRGRCGYPLRMSAIKCFLPDYLHTLISLWVTGIRRNLLCCLMVYRLFLQPFLHFLLFMNKGCDPLGLPIIIPAVLMGTRRLLSLPQSLSECSSRLQCIISQSYQLMLY